MPYKVKLLKATRVHGKPAKAGAEVTVDTNYLIKNGKAELIEKIKTSHSANATPGNVSEVEQLKAELSDVQSELEDAQLALKKVTAERDTANGEIANVVEQRDSALAELAELKKPAPSNKSKS